MTKRKVHSLASLAACFLIALSMQTYVNAGSTRPTSLQEATDISATTNKTITAAGFETAGNATAAYFIGDGSLLTGIGGSTLQAVTDAGKTTTNDITVAGITNNGTFTMGTNVATATGKFDANIYGYNAGLVSDIPRLYWDASKGAIRSGYDTTGAYWADGVTGIGSIAVGYNAKANGNFAASFGYTVSANNQHSFAAGSNTSATADVAIALGRECTASANSSVAMGYLCTASGIHSFAAGSSNISSGAQSVALGYGNTASGADSVAIGNYTTASVANAIALGHGVDNTNRLANGTANSLMVGFNSTVPTLYVSGGSGSGTYGQVGIGTTSPLAGSLIDVEGVLNSASIMSEGTIFATDTISSVAGFIASGSAGIDTSWTVCCTWDSFDCTATGTVTVTKGIITANACP